MRLKAIAQLTAATLITSIFGEKPFEVVFKRTEKAPVNDGDSVEWVWSVDLSFDNPEARQQLLALIPTILFVNNPAKPSSLRITVEKTNVGEQIQFYSVNTSTLKGGNAKLRKVFSQLNEGYAAAMNAVAWAWDSGELSAQLNNQAVALCTTNPLLVNDLKIRLRTIKKCPNCKTYHTSSSDEFFTSLLGIDTVHAGEINFFDKEGEFSKSSFAEPVFGRLQTTLVDVLKTAMGEYVTLVQQRFLQQAPAELLEMAHRISSLNGTLNMLGIEVAEDPALGMLMNAIASYENEVTIRKAEEADANASGNLVTFKVYRDGELVQTIDVSSRIIKIGSDKNCHLQIEGLPRMQAVIENDPKAALCLIDMGEDIPTTVNGQEITKTVLHSGQQIGFGENIAVELSYNTVDKADASAPPINTMHATPDLGATQAPN